LKRVEDIGVNTYSILRSLQSLRIIYDGQIKETHWKKNIKKEKSELGRQPPTSEHGTHIKRMLKFCTFIFCL
jgi:hypothetical protein